MKMRDWESTLMQAWNNNVGTLSVLDVLSNLGGVCSPPAYSYACQCYILSHDQLSAKLHCRKVGC